MAPGLAAGAALVDYGTDRGDVVLIGAATGVGVGVAQALVLARHRVPGAFWWAVANPLVEASRQQVEERVERERQQDEQNARSAFQVH
jgi:hypothetical protein